MWYMVTTLRIYCLHLQVVKPSTVKYEAIYLSETTAATYRSNHNTGDRNLYVRFHSFDIFLWYFPYFYRIILLQYVFHNSFGFISVFFVPSILLTCFMRFLIVSILDFSPIYHHTADCLCKTSSDVMITPSITIETRMRFLRTVILCIYLSSLH